MKSITTEGIVLLRKPYQENKVRLEILTSDLGRCSVIWQAGSGRRRWSGLMEPTHHLRLTLHAGRSFYTITGCELGASFPTFRTNYDRFLDAIRGIQIIRGITMMDQENRPLFNRLLELMHALNTQLENNSLLEQFRLDVLALEGIFPVQVEMSDAVDLLENYAGKRL